MKGPGPRFGSHTRDFLFLPILLLSLAPPTLAQEVPLERFREDLRKAHYSYDREGLKSFHCQVHLAGGIKAKVEGMEEVFPVALDFFQDSGFSLDYGLDGVKVRPLPGQDLQDKKAVGRLKDTQETLQGLTSLWSTLTQLSQRKSAPTRKGLFSKKVFRTDTGWKLIANDPSKKLILRFGPDYSLTHLTFHEKKEKPVTLLTDFKETPQGLLIRSCSWAYEKMDCTVRVDYQTIKGFFLPSRIEAKLKGPGFPPVTLKITFDHYRVEL